MTRNLLKAFSAAIIAAVLVSCSTDDPVKPTSKMSGAINGQNYSTSSVTGVSQNYEFYLEGNTGSDIIRITTLNPADTGTFALGNPSTSYHFAEVYRGVKTYKTSDYSGTLEITYVEQSANKISRLVGNYEFTAYYSSTDSVVVTNGKADFRY